MNRFSILYRLNSVIFMQLVFINLSVCLDVFVQYITRITVTPANACKVIKTSRNILGDIVRFYYTVCSKQ